MSILTLRPMVQYSRQSEPACRQAGVFIIAGGLVLLPSVQPSRQFEYFHQGGSIDENVSRTREYRNRLCSRYNFFIRPAPAKITRTDGCWIPDSKFKILN